MRPIIVANWKMNGTMGQARELVSNLVSKEREYPMGCEVVLCPPFPYLSLVNHGLVGSNFTLGAQDCHIRQQGAFTGDVSASMLKDVGCRYIILGHSERRQHHGESNALIAQKVAAAHEMGLVAIVCIGETLEERDTNRTVDILKAQIEESLPKSATAENVILAYEPIWAIGTGLVPTHDLLERTFAFLNQHMQQPRLGASALRLLYGGSVTGDNAAAILKIPFISGLLVGGASLKAEEFWRIITSG